MRCCRVSSRRSVSVIAAQLQKHASIPSPLASPMQRERHVVSSELRRLWLGRSSCSVGAAARHSYLKTSPKIPTRSDASTCACGRRCATGPHRWLLCHVALSLHCATHQTLPTTHCAVGRSTDTAMSHAIQHRCQAAIDVLDTLVQAQVPHLNQDWADSPCPQHVYTGTRVTRATSAPGLGSPLPHLRRDWGCGVAGEGGKAAGVLEQ